MWLARLAVPAGLLLGGCGLESALGPAAVVGGGSVVLAGRTPVDAVVSLVQGADCSVVRLDRGESYCAPPEPPPAPQPFCTRSLGGVDCWTVPPRAEPAHRTLAHHPPAPPPPPAPWWSRRPVPEPTATATAAGGGGMPPAVVPAAPPPGVVPAAAMEGGRSTASP